MTNEQLDVREPTNSSKNNMEQKPVVVGKLRPAFLSQLRSSGVQRAGEGSLVHVKAC